MYFLIHIHFTSFKNVNPVRPTCIYMHLQTAPHIALICGFLRLSLRLTNVFFLCSRSDLSQTHAQCPVMWTTALHYNGHMHTPDYTKYRVGVRSKSLTPYTGDFKLCQESLKSPQINAGMLTNIERFVNALSLVCKYIVTAFTFINCIYESQNTFVKRMSFICELKLTVATHQDFTPIFIPINILR